jgi:hypothetical protein
MSAASTLILLALVIAAIVEVAAFLAINDERPAPRVLPK